MGYVPEWNRQSYKKSSPLEKPVVRKFAEGGPVTQDTREAASGASYDSISDFMNYVRGRGKYDVRAMDNPFTESTKPMVSEAREDPDPVPLPQQKEPVNTVAPEDGNVGGPREESPAKAAAPARRQVRRVPPPSSSAPARVAANPVKPVPVATTGASPEDGNVRGPMAPPSVSTGSTSSKPGAMDRGSVARRASSTTLQSLLDMRPPTGRFADGGVVGTIEGAMASAGKKLVETVEPAAKAAWPYVEKGVETATPYVKKAYEAVTSFVPKEATLSGMIEGALNADKEGRDRKQKKMADGGLVRGGAQKSSGDWTRGNFKKSGC